MRNAVVYVLANHKKHRASAAATVYAFDDVRRWWNVPPPTATPTTWLASLGWLRDGPLRIDEAPADTG